MTFIEHVDPDYRSFFLAFRDEWTDEAFVKFHAHQGLELLFIHEGRGRVEVEGRSYELEEGAVFCFQPYQLHRVEIPERGDARYVRTNLTFDPRYLESYLEPYPKLRAFLRYLSKAALPSPKFKFEESVLTGLVESQVREAQGSDEGREEARILLLISVLRYLQLKVVSPAEPSPEGWTVRKTAHIEAIMDGIERHYKQIFSLDRLADELHLSPYYVSHLFKQCTGVSLTDYLTARRIREACALLGNSDKSVRQIAREIGGLSSTYFCKLFKRHKRMTPLNYRAALRRPAKGRSTPR